MSPLIFTFDSIYAIILIKKGMKNKMKTWNDYKEHIKNTSPDGKAEIDEIEALSKIISSIIERRNSLGISQRELAKLCNMPQSSVARIESYKTVPKLDTLLKITQSLGLNLTISPA
jgi:ribosome-binding protein aMBF1 (putative translation factor)